LNKVKKYDAVLQSMQTIIRKNILNTNSPCHIVFYKLYKKTQKSHLRYEIAGTVSMIGIKLQKK